MSYYVRFEVYWDGPGFDISDKKACQAVFSQVEDYIRSEKAKAKGREIRGDVGYPAMDWLEEFRKAFAGKGAEIKGLDKEWIASLLRHISGQFPGVIFGARGVGEELDDVWVPWYRDGRKARSPSKEEG
jgi:hypothetical protein